MIGRTATHRGEPGWQRGVLFAAAVFASGCMPGRSQSSAALPSPSVPSGVPVAPQRCLLPEQPAALLQASADPGGFPSARCVEKARSLLAQMTLEEKLGQMFQAERGTVREGDIARYAFGSVLSGGGSNPAQNTPLEWARMVTSFHEQSLHTRLGIPLLYGVDAVHGHNNVRGAVIFPHNIGLGATRDPDLVERVGRATALEVAATGADWTFSPVLAAARDERWGRTYESFGESPELAESLGPALIRGLQGAHLGARP